MAFMRFGISAIGLTAVLLLQGCASDCVQWEDRPITRQVCARWSNNQCAHYTMEHTVQRVCTASRAPEKAQPSAQGSSAPAAVPKAPQRNPAEFGLPDLAGFQRALFNAIRSTKIAYEGISREVLEPSQLKYLGTPQVEALVQAGARGGESASRYSEYRANEHGHRVRVVVVRMKSADAARDVVELRRQQASGSKYVAPLRVSPPAGVNVFAFDSVPAPGHEYLRSRFVTAAKGPFVVFFSESRELPPRARKGPFEPVNPFSVEFVLQQVASAIPVQ